MLFPTVFGDWKRWLVLISIAGTNSTLFTAQWWFAEDLVGTAWGSVSALWCVMTAINVVGLCWAWQRHSHRVMTGQAPLLAGRLELILLGVASLGGVITLVVCLRFGQPLIDPMWLPVWTFVAGMWLGLAYVLWTYYRGERLIPALGSETVVLVGLVLSCVLFMPLLPGRANAEGSAAIGAPITEQEYNVSLQWAFRLPSRGSISSSPIVVGDRVYIAAAYDHSFKPWGALHCLDRETGKQIWAFDDAKGMRQVYSTPVITKDRILIGEGFHQDEMCKVYCLDLDGKKLWEFQTQSHTESTASVVGDRVYIGAGDDGFYCLDLKNGNKIWNLPEFHIDSGSTVRDSRVYVGAGVGDIFKTTALFCLNAQSGNPIWRIATDYPVWSRPFVAGERLYIGTGNGRANEADPKPGGQVLCLSQKDGSEIWKVKLPDGVLARLGVDRRCLYVNCRDGHVRCLMRHDGDEVWKQNLGSPVVAAPVLDNVEENKQASRLYVVGLAGQFACLEAATGKIVWVKQIADEVNTDVEVVSTPALELGEARRLYVGITMMGAARLGELRCYQESKKGP
jgi:outer membrane protein assembly factor BamB